MFSKKSPYFSTPLCNDNNILLKSFFFISFLLSRYLPSKLLAFNTFKTQYKMYVHVSIINNSITYLSIY